MGQMANHSRAPPQITHCRKVWQRRHWMPCSKGRRCCMKRHHTGRNRQIRWPYFWRETRNNSGPSPRGPCMSMLCWMLRKVSAGGQAVRLNQENMTFDSLSLFWSGIYMQYYIPEYNTRELPISHAHLLTKPTSPAKGLSIGPNYPQKAPTWQCGRRSIFLVGGCCR